MYPDAENADLIGTFPGLAKAGGGYVWDEVLEYRVWMYPRDGAPDEQNGDDYYYVFSNYVDAKLFSDENVGAGSPLALILQREYIDEPTPGNYRHVEEQRIAEWPAEFLSRPRRNENTIPDFFAPDAPENRLDILRGLA